MIKIKCIFFSLFLLPITGKSQTNGFAVDFEYEQRIQDARRHNNELNNAYASRYKKFKDDYIYALGLNAVKDSPKELPSKGLFDAIITNGYNILENCEATVIDNQVTSIKNKNGNIVKVLKSSYITNFRAIITLSNNVDMEIIFTFLFN